MFSLQETSLRQIIRNLISTGCFTVRKLVDIVQEEAVTASKELGLDKKRVFYCASFGGYELSEETEMINKSLGGTRKRSDPRLKLAVRIVGLKNCLVNFTYNGLAVEQWMQPATDEYEVGQIIRNLLSDPCTSWSNYFRAAYFGISTTKTVTHADVEYINKILCKVINEEWHDIDIVLELSRTNFDPEIAIQAIDMIGCMFSSTRYCTLDYVDIEWFSEYEIHEYDGRETVSSR